jgi:hypothetical protein
LRFVIWFTLYFLRIRCNKTFVVPTNVLFTVQGRTRRHSTGCSGVRG